MHKIESFEIEETGMRFYQYGRLTYPSVTTVLDAALPPDDHLKDFWRQNGWVGQTVFKKLGQEGTRVHEAICQLEAGQSVYSAGYNAKEKKCIQGFLDWNEKIHPKLVASEQPVFCKKYKYAGRYDRIYEINGETWLVDFKTGSRKDADQYQVAAYWFAIKDLYPGLKCALLYLNSTSKQGFTWTEFEPADPFKTFLLLRKTFDLLYPDPLAKRRIYPDEFKI